MEAFRFENPEFLYFLPGIAILWIVFALSRYYRHKLLSKFGNLQQVQQLMPTLSVRRPWIKFGLFTLALASLIIAIANPMVGRQPEVADARGINLVVVLDVSRSMLAEDVNPNRMEKARLVANRLLSQMEGHRAGLVLFAGTAITQIPITADLSALHLVLSSADPSYRAVQGTALGAAIERAIAAFEETALKNNVIVVISDGENHADDPIDAAALAAGKGIVIHTIGIGTREGAPIPVYENNRLAGFHRDRQGNTVVTRLDDVILSEIAEATGGIYSASTGAGLGVSAVVGQMQVMEHATLEHVTFAEYHSRFYVFLALGLFLLLVELLIADRKSKWLRIEKLFS